MPVIAIESVEKNLFNYLHDVIYDSANAVLDVETLPENFRDFGKGLKYFAENVMETKALAKALSAGVLNDKLPACDNEIAAPLKSLHASLKHLTWQAQQIAQGDYRQRVVFMGEFSDAFNMMVEQLAERQRRLEEKIDRIQQKTTSLEQSNLLLTTLVHYIPQQIIVIGKKNREILFMNDIAKTEVNNDADYIENLMQFMSDRDDLNNG